MQDLCQQTKRCLQVEHITKNEREECLENKKVVDESIVICITLFPTDKIVRGVKSKCELPGHVILMQSHTNTSIASQWADDFSPNECPIGAKVARQTSNL